MQKKLHKKTKVSLKAQSGRTELYLLAFTTLTHLQVTSHMTWFSTTITNLHYPLAELV